jgi:hypothetical protein
VNFLWGFLTVVFAAALLRGHFGAGTTTSRIVIDVVFGALLAGSVGAWVWFRRHPARLDITPEGIAFRHRGQSGSTRLVSPGELYVRTTYIGGTDRLHWLMVTGSDAAISLNMFNHGEVKDACRTNGWRFVGDP